MRRLPPGAALQSGSDHVIQPDNDSCFFAVVSMLTGVPLDALPWGDAELVPSLFATKMTGDSEYTFDPSRCYSHVDDAETTIHTWNEALAPSLRMVEYTEVPEGIDVGVVLLNPFTGWCHTVVQTAAGYILDPSPYAPRPSTSHAYYSGKAIPVRFFTIEAIDV